MPFSLADLLFDRFFLISSLIQSTMSTQGNNGDYGQGNPPEFGNAMAGGAFGVPSAPAQDPPMIHYRGNTLQQSFYMRDRMKLSREKPMIGCCMSATTGVDIARIVGQAGYDYVWIDWEHTPFSEHHLLFSTFV